MSRTVDITSQPYIELFDELLKPEGFVRKAKRYYKIIPESNVLQVFQRFPSDNKYKMTFTLSVLHSSMGQEIDTKHLAYLGYSQRLGSLGHPYDHWYEKFDMYKLFHENYPSEEARIQDMAAMVRRALVEARDDMQNFGLPFFAQRQTAAELVGFAIKENKKGGYPTAALAIYTGQWDWFLPHAKEGMEETIVDKEEWEEKKRAWEAEWNTGTLTEKQRKELQENLERAEWRSETETRVYERYTSFTKMIEERDISAMRKMLEENESRCRNSIKEVLHMDMPPLDLDEWEKNAQNLYAQG